MRLINTVTGEFEEFFDLSTIPRYAILSHTWVQSPETSEQLYHDVVKIQDNYRPSSQEEALLNSRSDNPGADPQVPTLSEGCTTSESHSSLPAVSLGNPCSELESPNVDIQTLPTSLTTFCPIFKDHDSHLSEKIRGACEIARRDGYHYIWIDSCCIDKTSSAELSEAINSMFNWYGTAHVCYAFLPDVPSDEDVRAKDSEFRNSRWFTRGWTLQELIAPRKVIFFSRDWERLGTKKELAGVIEEITSINEKILTHKKALIEESVGDRMRWAAKRETTRVEDQAYSLLGIFGITMSTLYGEGQNAFRRLQEEILQRIPDQSLFAWGSVCTPFPPTLSKIKFDFRLKDSLTLFAPSPEYFASSSPSRDTMIQRAMGNWIESLNIPIEEYTRTPFGIRTKLCLLPLLALNKHLRVTGDKSEDVLWHLVIFRSQHVNNPTSLLSRLCYLRGDEAKVKFLHLPDGMAMTPPLPDHLKKNLITFTLSQDDFRRFRKQLQIKTVYLPHFEPSVRGFQTPLSPSCSQARPNDELANEQGQS